MEIVRNIQGNAPDKIYTKNKNKFTTSTIIAKKYWELMDAFCPMKTKEPMSSAWGYRIQAVRKVNSKQVNISRLIRGNLKIRLEKMGNQH